MYIERKYYQKRNKNRVCKVRDTIRQEFGLCSYCEGMGSSFSSELHFTIKLPETDKLVSMRTGGVCSFDKWSILKLKETLEAKAINFRVVVMDEIEQGLSQVHRNCKLKVTAI
ncbi:uncharacterized protein [Dysidea avara]|uniref:uncharacterized protein n=1 Tax=Dysidea avara TaxID=196820 RepID=UPI003320F7E7